MGYEMRNLDISSFLREENPDDEREYSTIRELEEKIISLSKYIEELESKLHLLEKGNDSTQNNEKEVKDLKTQLEQQKAENQELINGLLDMNNALHDLKTLLTAQKTKIEEKDAKILEKEVRIQVKDTIIKEKNSKIKEKDEALKINEYKISYLTYLIEIQSQKVAEIKKGPPAPPTEWLVEQDSNPPQRHLNVRDLCPKLQEKDSNVQETGIKVQENGTKIQENC